MRSSLESICCRWICQFAIFELPWLSETAPSNITVHAGKFLFFLKMLPPLISLVYTLYHELRCSVSCDGRRITDYGYGVDKIWVLFTL